MITKSTVAGGRGSHTEAGLTVLDGPAHTVVMVSGDLDLATAPALRERLTALLRPGLRVLILDLSRVSFCDAAGLAVLIGTQRRAAPRGIALRLAAPRRQVAKILHLTGLDRALTVHPTQAAALAECGAPGAAVRGPAGAGAGPDRAGALR